MEFESEAITVAHSAESFVFALQQVEELPLSQDERRRRSNEMKQGEMNSFAYLLITDFIKKRTSESKAKHFHNNYHRLNRHFIHSVGLSVD
ncbi:CLUMA_CG006139, isoform A [Clunio marinus]|uniref:CLUMA_CG006139, isoform A n=1 Tax=Clunio marinus TaxID=568069 RepID=A0A1J1HYE1_9DIPT|nr:CLUMA_CG006139, isoform A [Clunio marinus]